MQAFYPAIYRDQYGEEATTIENDGHSLHMQLRGVPFSGSDFDAFAPLASTTSAYLATFTLNDGALCACEIACAIPIPIGGADPRILGTLHMQLTLGRPRSAPPGGIDAERLTVQLTAAGQVFTSRGTSGWFEDELLDIQRLLPGTMYLKACSMCAFSDYSPYGHGLFGGLACFRDHKAAYRAVNSKAALFQLWPKLTAFVQETYLCDAFEQRMAGTGYRG